MIIIIIKINIIKAEIISQGQGNSPPGSISAVPCNGYGIPKLDYDRYTL